MVAREPHPTDPWVDIRKVRKQHQASNMVDHHGDVPKD